MGVTDGVPYRGLNIVVADLIGFNERFLAICKGLLIIPEQAEMPGHVSPLAGLSTPVAGFPIQVQRLLGVAERVRRASLLAEQVCDDAVHVGLQGALAELLR